MLLKFPHTPFFISLLIVGKSPFSINGFIKSNVAPSNPTTITLGMSNITFLDSMLDSGFHVEQKASVIVYPIRRAIKIESSVEFQRIEGEIVEIVVFQQI